MDKTDINNYPDELITAYLNGKLDILQQKELEEWVATDLAHKKYFYEMTEIWLSAGDGKKSSGNKEAVYQHFKKRIDRKKKSKKLTFRFIQAAASLFTAVLLLGGGIYLGKNSTKELISYTVQTIEVPLGSRSKIVLADGTIAWLNAGSKLSYPIEFSNKERIVNLEGEGYFEVTHKENSPFIVNVDDIAVKVLGTRFNISAYGDEDHIEVILAEGSVQLINKKNIDSSFLMKPDQQAVYNKKDGIINVRHIQASLANDWISGAHFFNELTFGQIARQLEKAFDVSFIFRNEDKKELVFYGDFRSDDSLDNILEIMARGKKFKYKKSSNLIEIY